LSVGTQAVSATYSVNTFEGKVASSQGTNYTVDSKTPYIWTLSYWDGSGWRRVFQVEADTSLALTFYLPATYLLRAEVPTSFYSGVVENTTISTQDELTITVSEGSGYKASNFLPGQIVSTSFSSYFLMTEIVEIWGTGSYTPPPVNNDPVDGGSAGDVILSVNKGESVSVKKNGTIEVPVMSEGEGITQIKVSGLYCDRSVVDLLEIKPGSGWIISGENGMSFTATRQFGTVGVTTVAIMVLKGKSGSSGITWAKDINNQPDQSKVSAYCGEKLIRPVTLIDSWIAVN